MAKYGYYPPTPADARGSASRITGFCLCNNNNKHQKNHGVLRFCEMVDTAGKLGGAWQQQQQQDLSLSLSLYIYNSLNMFYL